MDMNERMAQRIEKAKKKGRGNLHKEITAILKSRYMAAISYHKTIANDICKLIKKG